MLKIWTHPKSQEIRLYVAPKVIKKALATIGAPWDPKAVKAWLQEEDDHWTMKVTVRADDVVDDSPVDALRTVLMVNVGLVGNELWSDLVDNAKDIEKQNSKSAKKGRSEEPSTSSAARAKEAASLDISKIRMPGNVTIEVDHRETDLISQLLSKHPNINVTRVSLGLADFRVEDREGNELLIERKRCEPTSASPDARSDFETSIQNGRLFDQAERLRFKTDNSDHQVVPIVLLEGDVHTNSPGMLIQQVDGALSFLCSVERISILSSFGANHSAWIVAKLASHFVRGLVAPSNRHQAKPKALVSQKLHFLEALPGISTGIAEALLKKFGSIRKMAQAEEHELASVKGVGPKRSREIIRVLGEL